ncbi:MAG: tRNA pseudouridine synthase [Proteobacteria bacterium]|nr:tRNA pseudouridine synthase [Pseudomonadota bacterium]
MKIALGIEYFGGAFCGWQTQPNRKAVQDVLEAALSNIAGEKISTMCAGRTDAGVHACQQVVHFETEVKRPLMAWVRGVNTLLPDAVAVRWAQPVADEFHARFSAYGRRYRYLLINRAQRPGLWRGRCGWLHHPLDVEAMQAAAATLLGTHDFSAFRSAECQAKSPIKQMRQAEIRRQGNLIIFDFEADAFLQHMVRNLVGSLIFVGRKTRPVEWLAELLEQKDRKLAGLTFPPDGLYFLGPLYEKHWGLPQAEDDFLEGLSR